MRSVLVLSIPVMILLGVTDQAKAQRGYGGFGVGVGVGYGPYYGGPYWGPGWGGGWAYQPHSFPGGTWGNGLSMYGPPVPTGKPVPGMFGGGDSTFFPLPPLYPYPGFAWVPLHAPRRLPADLAPFEMLPPPAPLLDRPAGLQVEVRLPSPDAILSIDGQVVEGDGLVRTFATPPRPRADAFTYELRAEWKVDGLTTTSTKRVVGHAGDKKVVTFE